MNWLTVDKETILSGKAENGFSLLALFLKVFISKRKGGDNI